MCGIVYMHSNKAVQKKVMARYLEQRTRGNEGFGFISFTNGIIKTYKRFQNEKDVKKALQSVKDTHVLFHHRYPTSTENVAETAHPIKVSHSELKYDYYVVHNGVISNPSTLKLQHEKLGYTYNTVITTQYICANGVTYTGGTQFNDTESLAIELARNIELGTAITATGSASFIVLQVVKGGKKAVSLIYGTNGGNPLTINRDNKHSLCIASQGGDIDVPAMVLHTLDIKTNVMNTSTLDMVGYATKSTTIGYNSYQHGEMYDYDDDDLIGDDMPLQLPPFTNSKGIRDLEYMLEEIDRDIKIAKQSGENEELEDLLIEKQAIEESLLEYYYKPEYDKQIAF